MSSRALALPVDDPEQRLASLAAALQRLRRHLGGADADTAADILGQVLATQLLHGRDLYAVAGEQGAGKTTLLAELYAPDVVAWLPSNAGRGERVPVLVVEDPDVNEPTPFVHRLADADASLQDMLRLERVPAATWPGVLRGDGRDAVLAELRVPVTWFDGARRGFLLLPGYEQVSELNREFQQRMKRALMACGAFVVVTDHARLAQDGGRIIVDELARPLLAGADLVVAVTRTENLDSGEHDALRSSAASLFALEDRPDAVVLTGYGNAYRDTWREAFVAAVLSAGSLSKQLRGQQLSHLRETLDSGLGELLDSAEGQLAEAALGALGTKEYLGALQLFDESARRLRDELDNEIERLVGATVLSVTPLARKLVKDKESGWSLVGRQTLEFLRLRRDHRDERIRDEVRLLWAEQAVKLRTAHAADLQRASATRARVLTRPVETETQVEGLVIPDDVSQTLSVLSGRTEAELPPHAGVAYELLPALAISYHALGLRLDSVTAAALADKRDVPQKGLHAAVAGLDQDSKTLLVTLVGLFGLDLGIDAEVGSMSSVAKALSQAFTGGNTAAAAMMTPAAALVAASTAVAAMYLAIRSGEKALDYASHLVHLHGDATQEAMRASVRQVLALTRDVLERDLQRFFRIDEQFSQQQRARRALVDVQQERIRALELVRTAHVRPL